VEVGPALFPVHDWRSSRGGGSEATHFPAIYWTCISKGREEKIKTYHSGGPSREAEAVQGDVLGFFCDKTSPMLLTAPRALYLIYNTCLRDLISREHLQIWDLDE